jgi:DNA-binding transcriptional MocR family regulator
VPPPPAGLNFDDLLKLGMSQVLMRSDAHLLMTYQLGGGSVADRAAGVIWLAPMLGPVDPARLIVSPGAQAALAALILTLTEPGEAIVTEPLAYPGLRAAAQQMGRRVITAAVDEDGMRPDALDAVCRDQGARVVYLNPTTQNPTTRTMPEARRLALARIAASHDAAIIEDDPYWLLTPDAPPPIARLGPDRVYYIATLSKSLSPGLRTAYLVLPESGGGDGVLAALRSFALMSTPMTTALATQWIHDGSAIDLLDGIRTEAQARQAIARQWLTTIGQLPPSGIHVWHALPSYWTSRLLTRAARAEDLRVTASDAFYNGPDSGDAPNAIRISLGGVDDRAKLSGALRKLAELLASKPDATREVVV